MTDKRDPDAGVGTPPWRPFLDDARSRVAEFVRDGQAGRLLASDTPTLAEQLWTSARDGDGAVPLAAAQAAADLYWHRHLARGRPADDEELGAAVALFAMITEVDANAVPEALRPLVDDVRRQWKAEASGDCQYADGDDAAFAEATDLLLAAQEGETGASLDEAISRFRRMRNRLSRRSRPRQRRGRVGDRDRPGHHGTATPRISVQLTSLMRPANRANPVHTVPLLPCAHCRPPAHGLGPPQRYSPFTNRVITRTLAPIRRAEGNGMYSEAFSCSCRRGSPSMARRAWFRSASDIAAKTSVTHFSSSTVSPHQQGRNHPWRPT